MVTQDKMYKTKEIESKSEQNVDWMKADYALDTEAKHWDEDE